MEALLFIHQLSDLYLIFSFMEFMQQLQKALSKHGSRILRMIQTLQQRLVFIHLVRAFAVCLRVLLPGLSGHQFGPSFTFGATAFIAFSVIIYFRLSFRKN
jgi:hypothetical protein